MKLSTFGFLLLLLVIESDQEKTSRRRVRNEMIFKERSRRQNMDNGLENHKLLKMMLDKRMDSLSNVTRMSKSSNRGKVFEIEKVKSQRSLDQLPSRTSIGQKLRLLKEKQKMQRTQDLRNMLMRLRTMDKKFDSQDKLHECEMLRRENEELKKELEQKNYEIKKLIEKEQLETSVNFKMLQGLMSESQRTDSRQIPVLEQIQGSLEVDSREEQIGPTRSLANHEIITEKSLSSFLVTGTPSTSTIFSTSSYLTTITEDITSVLKLWFRGQKITTEVINTNIKTTTITSTQTSTLVITPTPTWSTIQVLETKHVELSQPTEAAQLSTDEKPRSPKPEAADILQYLDSFQMLKKYFDTLQGIEGIRNIREDALVDNVKSEREIVLSSEPEPKLEPSLPKITATPTESFSLQTVFISGSVPGQYTTSVQTMIQA